MTVVFHVLVCLPLSAEFDIACFAWDFGLSMPKGIHMLIDRMLGAELPGASLTFVYRCPVIGVVHVLVASTLAIERTGACLTFVHFGQVSMFMDCTYRHVYGARYGGIRNEVSGSREGWFLVEAEMSMRPPI